MDHSQGPYKSRMEKLQKRWSQKERDEKLHIQKPIVRTDNCGANELLRKSKNQNTETGELLCDDKKNVINSVDDEGTTDETNNVSSNGDEVSMQCDWCNRFFASIRGVERHKTYCAWHPQRLAGENKSELLSRPIFK